MNRNDAMQAAGAVNRAAIDYGFEVAKPGMTKLELAQRVGDYIRSAGMRPAFNGYLGFPGDLCICIDEEIVHGVPNERTVKDGSILTLDCGVEYHNYYVDAARTDIVGSARSQEDIKLVFLGEQLFHSYVKQIKAGLTLYDVAKIGDQTFRPSGFEIYNNLCGHGIDIKIHQEPDIFHTLHGLPQSIITKLRSTKLTVGQTICIEPILSLTPIKKEKISPDKWTLITSDGSYTSHFEHTLLVLENTVEILS